MNDSLFSFFDVTQILCSKEDKQTCDAKHLDSVRNRRLVFGSFLNNHGGALRDT